MSYRVGIRAFVSLSLALAVTGGAGFALASEPEALPSAVAAVSGAADDGVSGVELPAVEPDQAASEDVPASGELAEAGVSADAPATEPGAADGSAPADGEPAAGEGEEDAAPSGSSDATPSGEADAGAGAPADMPSSSDADAPASSDASDADSSDGEAPLPAGSRADASASGDKPAASSDASASATTSAAADVSASGDKPASAAASSADEVASGDKLSASASSDTAGTASDAATQAGTDGWKKVGGAWYYCNAAGVPYTGERKIDGAWYYLDPAKGGARATGIATVAVSSGSGSFKTALYGADGKRLSGVQTVGGVTYYFETSTGAMHTGFRYDGTSMTYYDANGALVKGAAKLHGGWRNFSTGTGAMKTGFTKLSDRTVYYDTFDGAMQTGQLNVNGGWYMFDYGNGGMWTGLRYLAEDDKTVLYGSDGRMRYGEQSYDGGWYHFDETTGAMTRGWYHSSANGGKYVYYGSDGRMLYGDHVIDGVNRYFDPVTGAADKIGWQNPLGRYQVSTRRVQVSNPSGDGRFSYTSPSTIGLAADRWDCIETFISRAYDYLGTSYVWDYALAPGQGIDCAGLVMQALYATGMDLGSHYTPYNHYFVAGYDHYANDMAADDGFMQVDFNDRQRGDLIFYPGHVAIYLGDDMVIDSYPGSGANGVAVRSMWHYGVNYIVRRPFV